MTEECQHDGSVTQTLPEELTISPDPVCYVNGKLVPESAGAVSALDRGLLLGDGLFETMRTVGGRVLQWQRHWERLCNGAGVIGLTLPWTAVELNGAIRRTLDANDLYAATVRLTVTRGGSAARGLQPPAGIRPTLIVRATPFVPYSSQLYRDGMSVVVSRTVRRNELSPLSRVKSLCYLDNIVARQAAAESGADEALLLNSQGKVACATTANVFGVKAMRLHTPPVGDGALPGTARAQVCEELAPRIGCEVRQTHLAESALQEADEVFLTNALMGIMPVCKIDGRQVGAGAPGPVARKLQTAYAEWLRAQSTAEEG